MKKLLLTLAFISLNTLSANEASDINFTLNTTDNQTINITETKEGLDFEQFKGKAILLTLFGHRCPPCIREIPELIELTKNHKSDLEIVAIESQNYPIEEVKAFKKRHEMNYNVVPEIDYNDFISYIAGRAGYTSGIPLPLLIAIDKHGEVKGVQAGQLSQEELESLVKTLNE